MNKNNLALMAMWVSGACAGIMINSYVEMGKRQERIKRDYKVYRDLNELLNKVLQTENDLLKKELNKDEA